MAGKPVWIDRFEDLQIASFPFRIANLFAAVFFCLIFSYILMVFRVVGLGGIVWTVPLAYVNLLFFFGYMFVIVDYTAQGYQEVPKISGDLLYTGKSRFFKVLVVLSFFFSLFFLFRNPYWQVSFVLAASILFPMATCVIIMEESLVSALNPIKWIGVLMDIKADAAFLNYFAIQTGTIFLAYVSFFVDLGWFNLFTMLAFVMAMMTVFRSIGVALHSNAETLGIGIRFSKQVEEEQVQLARDRELSGFITGLYKLASSGQTAQAWQLLEKRIQDENYRTEADLFDQLRNWDNVRLAVKAGQGFIERLVARQDYRTCWNVLEFCYSANGESYKLLSAATVLDLSERAETRDQVKIMITLLRQFEEDFPNHPQQAEALLMASRFCAHDLDDFETAREIMAHLHTDYPAIHADKTYQALQAILSE